MPTGSDRRPPRLRPALRGDLQREPDSVVGAPDWVVLMAHAIGDTSTLSFSHALVLPLVLIATRFAGLVDAAARRRRRPPPARPHAMPHATTTCYAYLVRDLCVYRET